MAEGRGRRLSATKVVTSPRGPTDRASAALHSTEEVAIYHEVFKIPLAALHTVPWITTLIDHDVSPAREDEASEVVLTGGLSFRDYHTFFQAVRGLDVKVEVGLPQSRSSGEVIALGRDCSNVSIYTTWSNEQFSRKMAGCRIFAMPIAPGLTRSTGTRQF